MDACNPATTAYISKATTPIYAEVGINAKAFLEKQGFNEGKNIEPDI